MPDTTNYMILGYAVTVLILVLLVGYLVNKARNLRAELKMLETLEKEGQPTTEVAAQANAPASAPRDATSH